MTKRIHRIGDVLLVFLAALTSFLGAFGSLFSLDDDANSALNIEPDKK